MMASICHIVSGDLWGGQEAHVSNLLPALSRSGEHRVRAIILNQGILADRLKENSVDTRVIDEQSNSFLQLLSKINHDLRQHPVDIVHTHRYKEHLLASLLKVNGGCRFVVQTSHGGLEHYSGPERFKHYLSLSLAEALSSLSANVRLCVSRALYDSNQRLFGEKRVRYIPNAIPDQILNFELGQFNLRADLSVPHDSKLVGSIGRLVPIKGYSLLIEAFSLVAKDFPNAHLLIAGDGPEMSVLQEQAKKLNSRVHFLGFRNDALSIISSLDLFVISSLNEGMPQVLLEAMAVGTPVLSTAVGSIPEVLKEGELGLLSAPGNTEELADKIKFSLSNERHLKDMSELAQSRVKAHFSLSQQCASVSQIYQDLLRR